MKILDYRLKLKTKINITNKKNGWIIKNDYKFVNIFKITESLFISCDEINIKDDNNIELSNITLFDSNLIKMNSFHGFKFDSLVLINDSIFKDFENTSYLDNDNCIYFRHDFKKYLFIYSDGYFQGVKQSMIDFMDKYQSNFKNFNSGKKTIENLSEIFFRKEESLNIIGGENNKINIESKITQYGFILDLLNAFWRI
jgi:hypothetical protein